MYFEKKPDLKVKHPQIKRFDESLQKTTFLYWMLLYFGTYFTLVSVFEYLWITERESLQLMYFRYDKAKGTLAP